MDVSLYIASLHFYKWYFNSRFSLLWEIKKILYPGDVFSYTVNVFEKRRLFVVFYLKSEPESKIGRKK